MALHNWVGWQAELSARGTGTGRTTLATRPRQTAELADDTRHRRKLDGRGSRLGLEQTGDDLTARRPGTAASR
jgi:hypothetical protein